MDPIRPTGRLRAIGWPLLAVGVVLVVIVWPLFALGAATQTFTDSLTGTERGIDPTTLTATVAPWLGLAAIAAGVVLVVIAARRAAANREAVQRAQLAAFQQQP